MKGGSALGVEVGVEEATVPDDGDLRAVAGGGGDGGGGGGARGLAELAQMVGELGGDDGADVSPDGGELRRLPVLSPSRGRGDAVRVAGRGKELRPLRRRGRLHELDRPPAPAPSSAPTSPRFPVPISSPPGM